MPQERVRAEILIDQIIMIGKCKLIENVTRFVATKIHVSMETKILLDSCGSYFLEPRGLIVFPVSQISVVTKLGNWTEIRKGTDLCIMTESFLTTTTYIVCIYINKTNMNAPEYYHLVSSSNWIP